jgi:hypothetical protein
MVTRLMKDKAARRMSMGIEREKGKETIMSRSHRI